MCIVNILSPTDRVVVYTLYYRNFPLLFNIGHHTYQIKGHYLAEKNVEILRVYLSFKLLIIIFHQAQVVGNFSKVEDKI